MKRVMALLLLAALLLAGCAGRKLTVNHEEHTVFDGKYTYRFVDDSTVSTRTIRITYPNGGIYRWEQDLSQHHTTAHGRGNELYDPVEYTPGEELVEAIAGFGEEPKKPREVNWGAIIGGVVIIGLGIWIVADPYTHWNWRFGRWFKDPEPSDEGLGRIMATGYLEIAIGVISILAGIFA